MRLVLFILRGTIGRLDRDRLHGTAAHDYAAAQAVAADIGPIVNLSATENEFEGGVVDAVSTMMGLEITMENGRIEQKNFDSYPVLRIDKAPEVEVQFLASDYNPTGAGEPGFPPLAPAVCNAIFAATGKRIRTLPISKEGYTI